MKAIFASPVHFHDWNETSVAEAPGKGGRFAAEHPPFRWTDPQAWELDTSHMPKAGAEASERACEREMAKPCERMRIDPKSRSE